MPKWTELTLDGTKIAVPFAFHAAFPAQEMYKEIVLSMNKDLV